MTEQQNIEAIEKIISKRLYKWHKRNNSKPQAGATIDMRDWHEPSVVCSCGICALSSYLAEPVAKAIRVDDSVIEALKFAHKKRTFEGSPRSCFNRSADVLDEIADVCKKAVSQSPIWKVEDDPQ